MLPHLQSKTYQIENSLDKLTITIVNSKSYFKIARLGLWLLWGLGALYCLSILSIQILYSTLTNYELQKISLDSLIIWLFCIVMIVAFIRWLIQMRYGAYFFLWQMVGKEIIEVTAWSIKIRNQVLGIERIKEYRMDTISNLQSVSVTMMTFAFTRFGFTRFQVPTAGPITFTHNGRMIHLGLGLAENDGKAIIELIQSYFPKYTN